MSNTITVGKRLIPVNQIALAEPFEAKENSDFQSTRAFQTRLVMVDRTSVLAEESVAAFADAQQFRLVEADGVALNPAVRFRVETFTAPADFKSTKPFIARLLWRDLDGKDYSKLLLSDPETVLGIITQGEVKAQRMDRGGTRKGTRRRTRLAKELSFHP